MPCHVFVKKHLMDGSMDEEILALPVCLWLVSLLMPVYLGNGS